jgi:hypothetical protein
MEKRLKSISMISMIQYRKASKALVKAGFGNIDFCDPMEKSLKSIRKKVGFWKH